MLNIFHSVDAALAFLLLSVFVELISESAYIRVVDLYCYCFELWSLHSCSL